MKHTGLIAAAVTATTLISAACTSHQSTSAGAAPSSPASAPPRSSTPAAAMPNDEPTSAEQARLDWMKRKPSSWDTSPSQDSAPTGAGRPSSTPDGESSGAE